MASDSGEFGEDDAEVMAAFGDFNPEEFFNGEGVSEVVAVRVEVVHAVGHDDALLVSLEFGFLFHPGVEVADDALALNDGFAFELADHAEDAVGAGVLGPHVDDHGVFARLFEDGFGARDKSLGHRKSLVLRSLYSTQSRFGCGACEWAEVGSGQQKKRGHRVVSSLLHRL